MSAEAGADRGTFPATSGYPPHHVSLHSDIWDRPEELTEKPVTPNSLLMTCEALCRCARVKKKKKADV